MASENIKIEEICRICGSGENLCDTWLEEFTKTSERLQAVIFAEVSEYFFCIIPLKGRLLFIIFAFRIATG